MTELYEGSKNTYVTHTNCCTRLEDQHVCVMSVVHMCSDYDIGCNDRNECNDYSMCS